MIPLIMAGLSAAASAYSANRQASAARTAANASQFRPYNASMGGLGNIAYDGQSFSLNPAENAQQMALFDQLNRGAMGQMGQFQETQNNPYAQAGFLGNAYNQSNQYQNMPWQTQAGSMDLFGQGQSALGQLGSFDPNAAAMGYTNNLRAQAQPQEQQAAASMADRLFQGGRLGTTGGQGMFGQLINQQNQADLQRQVAGMQYGQQAQMNLAQMGSGLMGQGFGQLQQLNNMDYSRAQDRFGRAFQTFGGLQQAGQGALQNVNAMNGIVQGTQGQQFDQLLRMGALSANIGGAATGAGTNAAQIQQAGTSQALATGLNGFNGFLQGIGSYTGRPPVNSAGSPQGGGASFQSQY